MMRSLIFLTALAASVVASPVPEAAPSPVVQLGYASFKGFTDPTYNVTSWEGIYYAASPTGSNRWAPPVDIEQANAYKNTTVYDATKSGPICFQQSTGWNSGGSESGTSEDCLLLNVRKPLHPASSKLPVIVNIHGGGYNLGSASGSGYTYFVSVAKGEIMYVEIQYRLGGLGFLNSKEVQASGTANAGLLDQRSAIGWVKRHIAAFGGDPDKISIIGGSAGGGSVTAQVQLFGGVSKPPFRAAIAEYPWWQTYHTDSIYEKQYNDLLTATKCKNVACLRSVPYATLTTALDQISVEAYQQHAYGYGDFYWGPGVDGKVIKDLPHVAFSSGRFSKVPMLINHDADEGWPFTNWTAYHSEEDVTNELKILWPNANQTFFKQLETLYPTSSFEGNYFATPLLAATAPSTTLGAYLDKGYPGMANDYNTKNPYPYKRAQIFGDSFVSCGTRTVANSLVKYGLPVYKLIFNSGTLVHGAVDGVLGSPAGANEVGHTSQAEVQVLQAYFVSFMADLNPNTNAAFASVARPKWTSYGTGANVLYDDFTKFSVTTDSDKSARCQLMFDYGSQLCN